ncbi:MAG: hypothetical protein U0Q11_27440 [Vicinamibacterales bacterium]
MPRTIALLAATFTWWTIAVGLEGTIAAVEPTAFVTEWFAGAAVSAARLAIAWFAVAPIAAASTAA